MTHSYPLTSLYGDYLRTLIGLVFMGVPFYFALGNLFMMIVFGSLTATTVIIIGLTMISNVALFIVVVALLGFVLLAVRPVIHSWAMDMTPDEMSGSTISLLFATQSAFSALVPLVGGIIADAWGLSSVFYALAVAMVAANVMVHFLPDTR